MIRAKAQDYRLAAGSAVLRVSYWQCTTRRDLMSLIKRFATRENQSRQHGAPTFRWRRRRLGAVGVFGRRFEKVPEVFRKHKLPKMKSYYVIKETTFGRKAASRESRYLGCARKNR